MKLIMITGLASSGPLRCHRVGFDSSSFARNVVDETNCNRIFWSANEDPDRFEKNCSVIYRDNSYTNPVRAAPVWRPPVQRPRVLSLRPLKKAPPLAS
jgi:hypothetical protein